MYSNFKSKAKYKIVYVLHIFFWCRIFFENITYFYKFLTAKKGASCSCIFLLNRLKRSCLFSSFNTLRISRICVNCMCFVWVYLFHLSVCVSPEFMCFVFVFHLSLCVSSQFMGFHTIFMCQLYV